MILILLNVLIYQLNQQSQVYDAGRGHRDTSIMAMQNLPPDTAESVAAAVQKAIALENQPQQLRQQQFGTSAMVGGRPKRKSPPSTAGNGSAAARDQ